MDSEKLGNYILVAILFIMVLCLFHGKTVVKVPRYGVGGSIYNDYEVKEKVDAQTLEKFKELEKNRLEDKSQNSNFKPPCLSEQDPEIQEELLEKDAEIFNKMKDVLERIEEIHKKN